MPEDLDNLEDDQPDQGPKGLRDALKREQDRAGAAEARLAQFERESAFRDAGVDLTNPLHAAAVKGYDGAVDGIGEWVTNLGLTQTQAPTPPAVPEQEREGLERIFSASAGDGGAPAPEATADKDNEMRQATDQSIREGWSDTRYQDEMRRISTKYGMPVQQLPVEQTFGVTR